MNSSSSPLKPSQQRTLLAWYQALNKVNPDSFSDSLTQKIQQINTELNQNNYQILEEIPTLVTLNPDLQQAYEREREQLSKGYSSQEKDKLAADVTLPLKDDLSYSIRPLDSEQLIKTNRKVLLILQSLENCPLTPHDLKYRLNLPSSEITKLIKQLWNERKINKVSGNIWYNLLPIIPRRELIIDNDDSETYFTLTLLGKWQLKSFHHGKLF